MERTVFFDSEQLRLEGRLTEGDDRGAVICHPHPLYGGSMENNVVQAARVALQGLGWTTLRFNFRGVGQSEGSAGEGEAEVQDALAALKFLREERRIAAGRQILLGYSFGAWVGLRALGLHEALLGWVAVAPPVGVWDFSFVSGVPGRKLVLAGDRDTFCPKELLTTFLDALPEPKEHVILPGADHFLWGFESVLSRRIGAAVEGWTRV